MVRQKQKTLYIDISTLCRPFDDQSLMRIRIETDAYYLILQALQETKYAMVVSSVHIEEANAISDTEERREILAVLENFGTAAKCDAAVTRARAEFLHARKFGIADAAHVAFAEATADVFITCDDRLARKCRREKVGVITVNPVEFTVAEDLK
jgi:predicted nucleic acid-binding protein